MLIIHWPFPQRLYPSNQTSTRIISTPTQTRCNISIRLSMLCTPTRYEDMKLPNCVCASQRLSLGWRAHGPILAPNISILGVLYRTVQYGCTTHKKLGISYYRLIINWCSTSACGGFDVHQIRLPRGAKQFYSTQIRTSTKCTNVTQKRGLKSLLSVCPWEEEPQAQYAKNRVGSKGVTGLKTRGRPPRLDDF